MIISRINFILLDPSIITPTIFFHSFRFHHVMILVVVVVVLLSPLTLIRPSAADCSSNSTNISAAQLDRLVSACLPAIRDRLFKRDVDHDGTLSIYELTAATPVDQLKNSLNFFHSFDCDKNGVVTLTEMQQALASQILSRLIRSAATIIARYDKNHDGVINIYEVVQVEPDQNVKSAVNAFRTMDKNHDFKVGKAEAELFAYENALRNPTSVCHS